MEAGVYADCPDPTRRDPAKGIRLIEHAIALSPNPTYLTVLALAYFRSGDPEKAVVTQKQALESPRFPPGYREEALRQLHEYEKEATPTKILALVQERNSDQIGRLTVEVDSANPHRLTNLDVRAIPRPTEFALPHMSESELIEALHKKLDGDSAVDRFSGAVLVAKNGKPVFAQAYGLPDREHKLPNTLKTRFRIGSMNKMFTATSILQLAQAEKLGLDDPVGKYLTDYPNKDVATKVTIRQLLTHTGGTGDIFGPDFESHRLELRALQDYIKVYGSRASQFEPGSRWEYSNYGFILLGAIIEKVGGKSYYDYVRDHVYGPAGMASSGSNPEEETVPERSIGYTRMGGPDLRPNTDTLPYRGTSAGGGYSSVEDLLKFAFGSFR